MISFQTNSIWRFIYAIDLADNQSIRTILPFPNIALRLLANQHGESQHLCEQLQWRKLLEPIDELIWSQVSLINHHVYHLISF
jgi:hypothetical protein